MSYIMDFVTGFSLLLVVAMCLGLALGMFVFTAGLMIKATCLLFA